MSVIAGSDTLMPGIDYIVSQASASCKGTFGIVRINKTNISRLKKFRKKVLSGDFILIDTYGVEEEEQLAEIERLERYNTLKAGGIIVLTESIPAASMSQKNQGFPLIHIVRGSFPDETKKITVDIESRYFSNYKTQNVCGYIGGQTDSFIVFTAHYDHLGMMGQGTWFPGANDNGSGVAMLLNLAKHYASSENKPNYSVAFLFFSAEEVGLLGSFYYADNPLFPLSKIRFLFNLDLVGTGDDGIQIVNSTVFSKEYELLNGINEENQYLKQIKKRGEAANSDHYPFYAKGVRCFFIYTLGGISAYHNVYDRPETLPLTEFEDLFRLITTFVERYE
ncbi:MAG: M28 family peptidase [Bacteroidetes bacterium]|nr:M28 family peptidase [Bacteroidota bacterium]